MTDTPGDDPIGGQLHTQTSLVADIQQSTDLLERLVSGLTDTQSAQIVKLRKAMRGVAAGLVLDLLLTIGGVFLVEKAYDNAHHISANQQAIKDRQALTGPALCGLYDLFLDSYEPASPAAKADPARYEASFAQLESGARVFQCGHATRGRN